MENAAAIKDESADKKEKTSAKDITVNNIIVHKVEKKQKEKAILKMRDTVLPFKNDAENTTFQFVSDFSSIFRNSKKTSRVFGEFYADESNFPLVTYVRSYCQKQKDFISYSKDVAIRFHKVVDGISMATGGYVFCIDYTDHSEPSIAIVILTLKNGTSINDDTLDLSSNVMLDVEEINMAVNIKIDKWNNKEKSYLSFVQGKKGITNYFLEFIGCQKTENNVKVTHFVIDTVLEFDQELHREEANYLEHREQVVSLLYTNLSTANKRDGVEINSILTLVFNKDQRDRYYEKYDFDEHNIPSSFVPDARAYKKLVRFAFKKKGLDLKIDIELFDKGDYVGFTEKEGYLIIRDPEIKAAFDRSK